MSFQSTENNHKIPVALHVTILLNPSYQQIESLLKIHVQLTGFFHIRVCIECTVYVKFFENTFFIIISMLSLFLIAAPRIKAADQDLVVDVGQPLTMIVPYDAYPRAEAEWYKEDEALPTQTVDTTTDSTTFRIYEAKPSHKGSYKIILKNKHGKAEAHINVRVIGKFITFWVFSDDKKVKLSIKESG